MSLVERAPAKINLTLHVVGRRADGYHEIESLVVFTRSGDTLTLSPSETLSLTVDGPMAAMSGAIDDNLILRAARALERRTDPLKVGAFHLTKRLPVAAGIGGGSSDAAAALRILARLNGLALDDPRLVAAAAETGSDIPACLAAKARMMSGAGDTLGPIVSLPPLPALVVNPSVPLETKAVFKRMGLPIGWTTSASAHPDFSSGATTDMVYSRLARGRNDLEDAACVLVPVIRDVLAILGAAPGSRLARMSGSGATCFGLFTSCRALARAKNTIQRAHPGWWTKQAMLG